MKFLLPYFVLFLIVIQFLIRKNSKNDDNRNEKYWEREHLSNSSRKKDISNLNYIKIPDTLPFVTDLDNFELKKAQQQIIDLKDKKILNLTGLSNTDLKLEYGVANLTVLSEYDENFTILVKALNKAGSILLDNGYEKEGIAFLEYAIKCGSDIKATYTTLAKYYADHSLNDKIDKLIMYAENVKSIMKERIIQSLNEIKENAVV